MKIYVDIDNTICSTNGTNYQSATPIKKNIEKINKLFDEGHEIIYWTARGSVTKINHFALTEKQLKTWNCKYNSLSVGEKPYYDLLICDKTKRIEEI